MSDQFTPQITPQRHMKTSFKIFLALLGALAVAGLLYYGQQHGWVPEKKAKTSAVPQKAELYEPSQLKETAPTPVAAVSLPSTSRSPKNSQRPQIRLLLWAWNSQMGCMFANGGPETTAGSLVEKYGANVKFIRQDDPTEMRNQLYAFAEALKKGDPNPSTGAHFVAIMGDGAAAFLAPLDVQLKKLGPEYTAEVIGSCGYSRGEDKLMGPPEWRNNPQSMKGALIAGVVRDGDWNIAIKYAGDNEICVNPDENVYNPECVNFINTSTYVEAAEKYVAGQTVSLPVVETDPKTGKNRRTGETRNVAITGVVTWTPGDVTVAKKRGGLVSIISTKEYIYQMPNTIIGIRKWDSQNKAFAKAMLRAFFEGGDQVLQHEDALRKASSISAKVYSEENALYWEKYYRGVVEKDKQGTEVELGGSRANNLADNLLLFTQGIFDATYTTFGDIVKTMYPELVPNYPPASEVVNTTYIKEIASEVGVNVEQAQVAEFSGAEKGKAEVGRRAWRINFAFGSAKVTPEGAATLDQIFNSTSIAGNTLVEIIGHTDNVGSDEANQRLSEARAGAVKTYLQNRSRKLFPDNRINVSGLGATDPLVSNDTDAGRAKNRRVEIVLKAR